MKTFTFEVTKTIVVTVEAETYMAAVMDVEYDMSEGEYEASFAKAEPALNLIGEEKLK